MKNSFLDKIHLRLPEIENAFLGESESGDPFHAELNPPLEQKNNFAPSDLLVPDLRHTAIDPELKLGPARDRVDTYLSHMPGLSEVLEEQLRKGKQPLKDISVFLVHHLTAEILGYIAALRRLGCRDIVTVFVGYNPEAAEAYGPDLEDLKSEEFQYYVLDFDKEGGLTNPHISYELDQRFIKARRDEGEIPFREFKQSFAEREMSFLQAMECLTGFTFLRCLKRIRETGQRCLIIEDGAYISPLINECIAEKLSIQQVREKYYLPRDPHTDDELPLSLKESVGDKLIGSVEHTRNGYDRMMRLQRRYESLSFPVFTIAVSYVKTQLESDSVAATILNAIESVLFSQGFVLQRRNVHLLGCRGNIGRSLMKYLHGRLESPYEQLSGSDLKVKVKQLTTKLPDWYPDPTEPAIAGCLETSLYEELPPELRRELDLIIGITGGPSGECTTLKAEHMIDFLLYGKKRDLFIASGSTKTAEFPELLTWAGQLLPRQSGQVKISGRNAYAERKIIKSRISKRFYGTKYAFNILHEDGFWYPKNLYYLHDLMPINFLYYGVPTEVIEEVLAQLMSASLELLGHEALEPRIYAVDFDPEATHRVFHAQKLENNQRIFHGNSL